MGFVLLIDVDKYRSQRLSGRRIIDHARVKASYLNAL